MAAVKKEEDINKLSCLLITANVGTIFEDSDLLELWFNVLKTHFIKYKQQFVAIHCQEIGGKNYSSSMRNLSTFIDKFLNDETLNSEYDKTRIFLDEDFECLEKFTALGNIYLVHKSLSNVKLYNFKENNFETLVGRQVYSGKQGEPRAIHAQKVKFPLNLFPDCRSSRKGFMRTRWVVNDCDPIDMVNVHLFHDASNLVAMEKAPSPFAISRQKALEYTLKTISEPLKTQQTDTGDINTEHEQSTNQIPLFIFGDFNFRLDTGKFIEHFTSGSKPVIKRSSENNEITEVVYLKNKQSNQPTSVKSDDNSEVLMTVGKKRFVCENLDNTFRSYKNTTWLLTMDNELDNFKSSLHELKISFYPSYPYREDEHGGYSYMNTRCPAWCDRVLFNAAGKQIISLDDSSDSINEDSAQKLDTADGICKKNPTLYMLMGTDIPMGDHKPVYLQCTLNLTRKQSG